MSMRAYPLESFDSRRAGGLSEALVALLAVHPRF
jgi:hypothetical protein